MQAINKYELSYFVVVVIRVVHDTREIDTSINTIGIGIRIRINLMKLILELIPPISAL